MDAELANHTTDKASAIRTARYTYGITDSINDTVEAALRSEVVSIFGYG